LDALRAADNRKRAEAPVIPKGLAAVGGSLQTLQPVLPGLAVIGGQRGVLGFAPGSGWLMAESLWDRSL